MFLFIEKKEYRKWGILWEGQFTADVKSLGSAGDQGNGRHWPEGLVLIRDKDWRYLFGKHQQVHVNWDYKG